MLDHFTSWIPVSILITSLLGSWHCGAMCGGLVIGFNRRKSDHVFYHLGRLFAYLSLALIAGFLGQLIFKKSTHEFLPIVGTFILSSTLMIMGLKYFGVQIPLITKLSFYRFLIPHSWYKKEGSSFSRLLIGFASIFLPCGWLYGFVMAAAASASVTMAITILFFFWLGTLPALAAVAGFKNIFSKSVLGRKLSPKVTGTILISIALIAITVRAYPAFKKALAPKPADLPPAQEESCPFHEDNNDNNK